MKTVIFVNNDFKKKNGLGDLIIGLILFAISFSGLFMGSKFILKLVMYLVPFGLLLYALNILRIALSLIKTDKRHFVIFLIQAILIITGAIYVILFPIESLNYIIIFIGGIIIINSINTMLLTGTTFFSFGPFLIGILLILFSNSIINTFYKLFLIVLLFISISKITKFFINLKNRT